MKKLLVITVVLLGLVTLSGCNRDNKSAPPDIDNKTSIESESEIDDVTDALDKENMDDIDELDINELEK